ncbi:MULTISPECIES: hypothetical protein [Salimicrobium]|uniref:Uncharacterized protein n=3 Tax=Salimicrobium TaxID=351195 RepID=K2G8A9_9BACI|nr:MULTISPECIES: hypothetical protein [Salimicrobium]AKG04861.1 hypothetical protein AAV35_008620 [Salimicrobium jeotgali]EKE30607.1 hypothetical protein MJ3_13064 [Salimicrobium jeotgali]MBM7696841.1 hypothetical protein [Salimicrobium jeotgali]SDX41209.1 hypothetical protein SAMN04488081_0436 [Salimicrobium album]SIS46255.1 hypothetical protein SAMN05421758_101274 [Salimicrobium salexigens]
MENEAKMLHHFTDVKEFENEGLQNNGIDFPELEQMLNDYILTQQKETLFFKECVIQLKQRSDGDIRTVKITYQDDDLNSDIRLWGAKKEETGEVLTMSVDAVNLVSGEVVYERSLM